MSRASLMVAAALLGVGVSTAPKAKAANLYWDNDASTSGNVIATGVNLGGAGSWGAADAEWFNGTSDVAWTNANYDVANFIGTAGTVTLTDNFTVGGLYFGLDGFKLTGSTINLGGAASLYASLGQVGQVDSVLAGANGFTKTGSGIVRLTNAANSFAGAITITDGALAITSAAALGPSTSQVVVNSGGAKGLYGGQLFLQGTIDASGTAGMTISRDILANGYGPNNLGGGSIASFGSNTLSGTVSFATAMESELTSVGGLLTFSGALSLGNSVAIFGSNNNYGVANYLVSGMLTSTGTSSQFKKYGGTSTIIISPSSAAGYQGTFRSEQTGTIRFTDPSQTGVNMNTAGNGAFQMYGGYLEFRAGTTSGGTLNWGKTLYVANSSTNATYVQGTPGLALINQTNSFAEYSVYGGYSGTLSGRNGAGFTFGYTSLANSNSGTSAITFISSLGTGTTTITGNVTHTGTLNADRTVTFQVDGGDMVVGGSLLLNADATYKRALTKTGIGTLTVLGVGSTLEGATTISGIVPTSITGASGAVAITDFRSLNNAATTAINIGNATTTPGMLTIGTSVTPTVAGLTTSRVININTTTVNAYINASQPGANPVVISSNFTGVGNAAARALVLGGTNTADNLLSGILPNFTGTMGITKNDAGTWALSGANTYTGATTITGGTLKIKAALAASDVIKATGAIVFDQNAITYGAGGTLELVAVSNTATTEGLGALTPTNGAGTIKLTANGTGTAGLTFASLGTVSKTSGINFDLSSSPTGSVTFTAATASSATALFGNGHIYVNGANFAYASGTSAVVIAAPNYGTTTGFVDAGAGAATLTAANHNRITGDITDQTTLTVSSLKMSANTLTLAASNLLTIQLGANGEAPILVDGGSSVITGGTGITSGGTGAVVIRVNQASDQLTLQTPITSTSTGGWTKNGLGTLLIDTALVGSSSVTNTINEGKVKLNTGAAIGPGTYGSSSGTPNLVIRQGATLDLNGTSQPVGTLDGAGVVTNSSTTAQAYISAVAGTLFSGTFQEEAGAQKLNVMTLGANTVWSGLSTFTGVFTFAATNGTSGTFTRTSVMNLANIGAASAIGKGDATSTATNAASWVFTGNQFSGIRYTGLTSVSTDRLFTLNSAASNPGGLIENQSAFNSSLVFSNTNAIAFGAAANANAAAQGLTLAGSSTADSYFFPQLTDNVNATGAAQYTSLTKTGAGIWVLGNTANTYSGLTTITTGTLVGSYGAAGSVQSTLSPNSPIVINGGLLQMSGTLTRSLVAAAEAGTGTITLQATGGGFASDTEKLTVNIGGQATPSTLSFNSGGFFNVAAANLTLNSATSMAEVDLRNNLDLTGTAHTITVTNNPTTGTDFATISGVISNSGAAATLTIAASSTVLRLLGANTYAGTTAISSGTLTVNSLGNSGTAGVGTSVGTSTGANLVANAVTLGNSVLSYVGPGETSDRYIQLNGAVSPQIHADGTGALVLTNVQQGTTGAKSLYLRGTSLAANRITSNLADFGVLTLVIDGGATWILSGTNSYTGDTQVTQGTAGVGSNTAFGTGTLKMTNGQLFAYGADRTIANPVSSNITTSGSSTGFIGDYSLTLSGNVTSTETSASWTLRNSIASGKKLTFSGSTWTWNAMTSSRTLTVQGTGDTVINNNMTTTTTYDVNVAFSGSGSLLLAGTRGLGTLTQSGTSLQDGSSFKLSGNITRGSTQATGTLTLAGATANYGEISGIISDGATATAVTKSGTGIWVLSGANTYSGATTVSAGALTFANTSAKSAASTVTVASGAILGLMMGSSASYYSTTDVDSFFAGTLGGFTTDPASLVGLDTSLGDLTYASSITGTTRGLAKLGTGALTLSGINTYTGNTLVYGGTLNVTGKITGNTTSSVLSYGFGLRSVVNVSNDMSLYATVGANASGSVAVYNQTAGTVAISPGTGDSQYVANVGYGYFNLTGGTFRDVNRFDLNKSSTSAVGVAYIGGTGILDNSGGDWFILGWQGIGQMTVGPGGNVNRSGATNFLGMVAISATSSSSGTLNIAGGTFDAGPAAGALRFGNGGTSLVSNSVAFLNLAGGTFSVGGNFSLSVSPASSGNFFYTNFAGGTLKLNAAASPLLTTTQSTITGVNTLFGAISNSNIAGAPSFGGGLTINTNGFATTLPGITAATGTGVTQSNLSIVGGSGYVGAPAVTFSTVGLMPGGTPAAGYAVINDSGQLTGIVITSPGTYVAGTAPSVTLTGGGGTGAQVNVSPLNTANSTDAVINKIGAGMLTFAGINTFVTPLGIAAGNLSVASGGALNAGTLADYRAGRFLSVASNGAIVANTVAAATDVGRLTASSSTGVVAVTPTTASTDINLSATGLNLAGMGLGAGMGDTTYTGLYTPGLLGAYRLGGGGSNLTYQPDITGTTNSSVAIVGSSVSLTGANTFSGGFSLASTGVLQVTATNTSANFGASLGGLASSGGTIRWATGATTDISSGAGAIVGGIGFGATTTFDTNGNNVTLAGSLGNYAFNGVVLTGSGGLTKTGLGALTLGAANTFTGTTTVSAGSLVLAHDDALVRSSLVSTLGVSFAASVSSRVFSLGGLTGSTNLAMTNSAGAPITLRLGPNAFATGTAATASYSGILVGDGASLVKFGNSTQELSSSSLYTGTTTITAGNVGSGTLPQLISNLQLAFGASSTLTNVLPATTPLVFGGSAASMAGSGTLTLVGAAAANAQTVASTTLNPGLSSITLTASGTWGLTLNLGTITRNVGATLNATVGTPSATFNVQTTSGTAGTANLLTDANGTAYATLNGTDWASKDAGGTYLTALTGQTATVAGTTALTAGRDYDFVTNTTAFTGSNSIRSIRLPFSSATTAQTVTFTAGTTQTITSGGILYPTSTTASYTITGGTIIPGAGKELVVMVGSSSSSYSLTMSGVVLGDSVSGASSVTYRGLNQGVGRSPVVIGAANTYTGDTYISGARVYNNTTGTAIFGPNSSQNVYVFGNNGGQFMKATASTGTETKNWYVIGSGWSESTSGTYYGAVRVEGGTIAGTFNLLGDASIGNNSTTASTISANLVGNFALEKRGQGQITISGTNTNWSGSYNLTNGLTIFGSAAAYGTPTTVSIGSSASIGIGFASGLDLKTAVIDKVTPGSSGTIALLTAAAGQTVDFRGANAASLFLGAANAITYTGTYYPNVQNGVANYRFSGGAATLTYSGAITGNSTVTIGGGYGGLGASGSTVILNGVNTYTGGTTLAAAQNGNYLQVGAGANPYAVLGTGPLYLGGAYADIKLGGGSVPLADADFTASPNITKIVFIANTTFQFGTNGTGTSAAPVVLSKGFGNYASSNFQKVDSGWIRIDKTNTFVGSTNNYGGGILLNTANPFNAGYAFAGTASGQTYGQQSVTSSITQLGVDVTIGALTGANTTTTTANVGVINLNGKILTLAGTADSSFSGIIYGGVGGTGAGGITKLGAATQTIRGATTTSQNVYTGNTTILGGILSLDFGTLSVANVTTNLLPSTSPLVLGGGTLKVIGRSSASPTQTFANTTLNAGASAVTTTLGGTALGVTLGTITRNTGGTLDITGGTSITVSASNSNDGTGLLGGWATWGGGASFATVTGTTLGAATAPGVWATGANVENGTTAVIGASAINSLRFNSASAVTLDATGGLTIATGGILITPTVAANVVTITGGTITSGGSDLIVHQYASGGAIIASKITGAGVGLTKSGSGSLTVSNGTNDFGGITTIGGSGALIITASGALSTGQVNLVSAAQLQVAAGVTLGNNITISYASGTSSKGAIHMLDTTGTATISGSVYVNNSVIAGGVFGTAGGTLNVTGKVTAASGQIVGVRIGTVVFTNGTADSSYDYFAAASGTTALGGNNGLAVNAIVELSGAGAGAIFDLSGFNQTIAGLMKNNTNAGTVTNSSATASVLTLNVPASDGGISTGDLTYSGAITGNLSLVKSGAGSQTLSGVNTYAGSTTVSAGTLKLGSATALGGGVDFLNPTVILNGGTIDFNGLNGYAFGDFSGTGGTVTDSGLAAGASVLSVSSSSDATFAGAINDGGVRKLSFYKDGTGTLTLTGTSNYSGSARVWAGVLNVRNGSALGSATGATLVSAGATVQLQGGISTAEPFTLTGTGVGGFGVLRNISGGNTVSGLATLAATARINSDADTLTLSGGVSSANFPLTVGGAGNTTLSGALSLGSAGLTKDGSGTLTLSAANTYSGATSVTNGTLVIAHSAALGSTSSAVIGANASLQVQGGVTVSAIPVTTPILRNISGTNAWSGTVTAQNGGALTLQSDAGVLTVSAVNAQSADTASQALLLTGAANGVVSGVVSGASGLTKTGNGTWTLSGANTYVTPTTVSAGTLAAGAANAFSASSPVTLADAAGAVLDLAGFSQNIKSLDGAGATGGAVTLGSSGVLSTGANVSFGGAISGSGTSGLTKTGNGVMTLGPTGTVTGTVAVNVNQGTLLFNNTTATDATVSVTVANNAILGGKGVLGGMATIASGGMIQAGDGNSGNLSVASLTFGAAAGDTAKLRVFNLDATASVLDAGAVTANGGANSITIYAVNGGALANGTYSLLTYASLNDPTAFAAPTSATITGLSGRQGATLNFLSGSGSAGTLQMIVSGDSPKWTGLDGATSDLVWHLPTATAQNWQLITGATGTNYQAGDSVRFDDSAGSGNTTVAIGEGDVSPTSVTIDNATLAYVFNGAYGLTGSTGIVKNGAAAATFNNPNAFTGGVTVNAGTLTFTAANTIDGGLTLNGGTLKLDAANALTGGIEIGDGVLVLGAAGAIGTGNALTFAAGATGDLRLAGNSATIVGLSTNANVGTPLIENGSASTAAVLTVNLAAGTDTFAGVLQDGAAATLGLTKAGNGTLVLTGVNTFTGPAAVTGGVLQVGQGGVLSANSTAVAAGASLVFASSSSVSYAGGITGAGALTAQGGGTLTLSGDAAHSGGTSVVAGQTLALSGSGRLSGAGAISLAGTLSSGTDNTISAPISGAGALTVTAGTLILSGANSYAGSTTIASGATLQVGAGSTTGTLGSAASITDNGTLVVSRSADYAFGTNVAGTGGLTAAMTSGAKLTLTGVNAYSGTTTVASGTLFISNVNVWTNSTALVLGGAGTAGTLDLNGTSKSFTSLTSAGTASAQTITNSATGTSTITFAGANSTFGGSLADGSATKKVALVISGGGTLQLALTNAFTGGTTVTSGTAQLGANNAFGTGSLTLGGAGTSGTLDLNGYNQTIGTFAVGSGATASAQIIGNSSTSADGVLTYAGGNLTFASTIQDILGAGTRKTGLTLAGGSTLTLTGANTFTGTLSIPVGNTLQVGSAGTVGSIASPIANAGTLIFSRTDTLSLPSTVVVTGNGIVTLAQAGAVTVTADGQFNTTGVLNLGSANASTISTSLDLTNGSATFGSLVVRTNTAATNIITIGAGKTLTISGAVTVGYSSSANTTTSLTVSGAGALAIGTSASPTNNNIRIGGNITDAYSNGGTLDLGGLAEFSAYLGSGYLRVGDLTNSSGNATKNSTLVLAGNSLVSAALINIGSPDSSVSEYLKLGNGTNILNAATLVLGANTDGRSNGYLSFNGATGTLKMRSQADTVNGRVTLNVANMPTGNATGANPIGGFDVTGHNADLLLGTVTIASRAGGAGYATGSLSFDTGLFNASDLIVGQLLSGNSTTGVIGGTVSFAGGTVTLNSTTSPVKLGENTAANGTGSGTLNISGTAAVAVAGSSGVAFRLGNATAAAGTATGALNITGGTLTVAGGIVRGATTGTSTATLSLDGGVLDMGGFNLGGSGSSAGNLTSITLASGTLKNVGDINYGGAFSKTAGAGTNTLIIDGTNSFSGIFTIVAGTVQVGTGSTTGTLGTSAIVDNAALVFNRSDAATFANAISGTGTVTQSGSGNLTLTGANTYAGLTTVSAGTLTAATGALAGTSGIVVNGAVLAAVDFKSGANLTLDATATAAVSGAGLTVGGITNAGTAADALNFTATTGKVTVATLAGAGKTRFGSDADITGGVSIGNVTVVGALGANISGGTVSAGSLTGNVSGGTVTVTGLLTGNVTAGTVSAGSMTGSVGSSVTVSGLLTGAITAGTNSLGSLSSSSVTGGTNTITGAATVTTVNGGTTTVGGVATVTTLTTGTLNLNGATASVGTLTDGTINLGTTALTVNDGTFIGLLAGTNGSLIKATTGTLTLSFANTYGGGTAVNAGTLIVGNVGSLGSGAVTVANGATLNLAGFGVSNAITVATGGSIVGGPDVSATPTTGSPTVSTVLTGSTGLSKSDGGTLTLTTPNFFTGATEASGATAVIKAAFLADTSSSLGASDLSVPANLTLSSGATLEFNGSTNTSTARSFTIGGSAGIAATGAGTLEFTSASKIATTGSDPALTLTASNTGTNRFAPTLADGSNPLASLAIDGTGVWVIGSGANRFKGDVRVEAGTGATVGLESGALPSGATLAVGDGAKVRWESGNTTPVKLEVAANTTAKLDLGSNTVVFTASTVPVVTGTGNTTLEKQGGGALKIATGVSAPRVNVTLPANSGLLAVNGTIGNVSLASGSTLGGAGTVGNVTAGAGSTVGPGNSPGTLSASSLGLFGGSTFEWQVQDAKELTVNPGYDKLNISGAFDLSNASSANRITFKVVSLLGSGNGTALGDPLNFDAPGTTGLRPMVFNFATVGSLNLGANGNINDVFQFDVSQFTYSDGSTSNASLWSMNWDAGSNLITLTAVPEPSTYGFGLGALALAAAAIRRRRKNQPTKA